MNSLKMFTEAQTAANHWFSEFHGRSQAALWEVLGLTYSVYREAIADPEALEAAAVERGVKVRKDAPNRVATTVLKIVFRPKPGDGRATAFAGCVKVLAWLDRHNIEPGVAAQVIGGNGGVHGVIKLFNQEHNKADADDLKIVATAKIAKAVEVFPRLGVVNKAADGAVLTLCTGKDVKTPDDLGQQPGYILLVARVDEGFELSDLRVIERDEEKISRMVASRSRAMKANGTAPLSYPNSDDREEVANMTTPPVDNDNVPQDKATEIALLPPREPVAKVKLTGGSVFGVFGKHEPGQRNCEWYTPEWMLEPLYKAMGDQPFDLDPCSPIKGPNAPVWAKKHFTKDDDGLNQNWRGRVWLNPPYANLSEWVRKAADATWCSDMPSPPTEESAQREHPLCETVVALIPARTQTVYWEKYVTEHARVIFIHGKISFLVPTPEGLVKAKTQFPEGLAFVIWGNHRPFTDALLKADLRCRGVSDRSFKLSDDPWESYWKHRLHLRVQPEQGEAA